MIQLFMKRSGSPAIVPLHFPASHDAMTEAVSRLDEASRTGKTEIVEIKSVIASIYGGTGSRCRRVSPLFRQDAFWP